ncbi:hypothetical protein [Herbaspirillum sp. VT-16-41]|uniref:hypothetical protein n=1 Tax=Herbaspirillum sp. VT-16-41 TaxID=1953765 RepID=UPI000980B703|nr:hypothetical protein [Herbaspirillum sp. VT-16-41]ONN67809.1 hypothetical protein BTM36_04560 [Herbaspirillum sp. VT-16-41]
MSDWKEKVVLKDGETLRLDRSYSKGFMQEEDVNLYTILNRDGAEKVKVQVHDHTAVKGFRRTLSVVQTDHEGRTVVRESWNL